MAKAKAVDDLPDLSDKPAAPAKTEPRPAGVRTVKVTLELPLLPAGDADYLSHHVNIRLQTMEQRRTFRAIINGVGAKYPRPSGGSGKQAAADAIRYLLDQIAEQVSLVS